jgi:hypothetical protein
MNIPKKLRLELNALSKEVFGVPSKWQKFLEKGTNQIITRRVTRTIPGENGAEPTTQEVDEPILSSSGTKQSTSKIYTVEEIHALLLNYKGQIDQIKAMQKQQQEAQKAKQESDRTIQHVKDLAQGSAAV